MDSNRDCRARIWGYPEDRERHHGSFEEKTAPFSSQTRAALQSKPEEPMKTFSAHVLTVLLLALPAPSVANDAAHAKMDDASYVHMMREHHAQGVSMAKMAAERATRDDVRTFAKNVIDDQTKEITELDAIAAKLPKKGAGDALGSMSGMDKMEQRLRSASGAQFDREFLRTMTDHHQMAIDMSKNPEHFSSSEVKDFARKTTEKQRKEIEDMKRMQSAS